MDLLIINTVAMLSLFSTKRSSSLLDIHSYREFSQSQRGASADPRMFNQQFYRKKSEYPAATKKLLAIIIPIISLVVLTGIGVLAFLYYKRFRNEQNRARKLSGTIRLEDTYSSKFIAMIFFRSKLFVFSYSSRTTNREKRSFIEMNSNQARTCLL